MRLVHTRDIKLHEFTPNDVPRYAILSHTWTGEEVTFKEFDGPHPPQNMGYDKILKSCREASRVGLDYIWIDTCCIDKTSSAELSEAINSMYLWYQSAAVCYIYLPDVHTDVTLDLQSQIVGTRWVTRGWTLQELLASNLRVLFNSSWNMIGYSSKRRLNLNCIDMVERYGLCLPDLTATLARATRIPANVLQGERLDDISIAQRMSWAAYRKTTRIEDEAYCLMGIFNVNLPLIYGEGRKAFMRLQEEILRNSDDQSIFAHISPDCESPAGLLARSPTFFALSELIGRFRRAQTPSGTTLTASNKGLEVPLMVCPIPNSTACLAILDCTVGRSTIARPAIYLERYPNSADFNRNNSHRFLLTLTGEKFTSNGCLTVLGDGSDISVFESLEQIDLRQAHIQMIRVPTSHTYNNVLTLPLIQFDVVDERIELLSVTPKRFWDNNTRTLMWHSEAFQPGTTQSVFAFRELSSGISFNVVVGFDYEACDASEQEIWLPWCYTFSLKNKESLELGKYLVSGLIIEGDRISQNKDVCHGQARTKTSHADLSSDLPHLIQATLRSRGFLGRLEVLLQVELLPKSERLHFRC